MLPGRFVPVQRQVVLLLNSGIVWFLFAACVMLVVFFEMEDRAFHQGMTLALMGAFDFLPAVGIGWAICIAHIERHYRRSYHWSMPVDSAAHDLARVGAGAIWLLPGLVVFCLSGIAVAVSDGRADAIEAAPPLFWIQCFTTPLLAYLFCSVVVLRTDKALEWLIGIATVGLTALTVFARPLRTLVLDPLFESANGFDAAMSGG
jgi:hypothetical protein